MSVMQGAQQRNRIGTKRKLRRLKNSSLPFFPYWFVPILGLVLLTLLTSSCVDSTTQRTTDDALAKIGADWVRPDVSGRHVTLRGTPPDATAASAAYNAVKTAKSETFLGTGIQATRVFEAYENAPVPADDIASNPAPADIALTPEAATDHAWRFERKDNVVTLTGEVPDQAMRTSIVESTRFAANGARIEDQLTVTGRTAGTGYGATALRGAQALGRCTNGFTAFAQNTFSLNCEAKQADTTELRLLASTQLAFGTIGSISVLATEEIVNCENQLGALLTNARIEFATGSAVINAASANLLTSIAAEAKTCPGTLRIEGHTDNEGSAERNAELSLQRANAVRLALISRGLDGAQLITEGFGPALPIASNTTELGRSRNRRIQFRVVRP